MSGRRATVIGGGRAGSAFAGALTRRGWTIVGVLGRDDDIAAAGAHSDLVLIATPDGAVAEVAKTIEPSGDTVVAHVAGVLALDVLAPHPRVASVHPLMSIPHGEAGIQRLVSGGWFAVAGDAIGRLVVDDLGGTAITVSDDHRIRYHALASIASNHLVALLGQVERLAAGIDVPFEAYLDLATGSLAAVEASGPAEALTGPASRGDDATLAAHLASLPVADRVAYVALMREAQRLAAVPTPDGSAS
jgi:predicted short-subunit dehydrogenase-like oxidoreductase (DUF2520 family)